ncbi:MAG: helix-turn-helix transcriptional regulator [Actinobacteria bacterium]|nr:helix-turn-helix transcriptional regulator [Actinomycetota bacterium]
MHFKSQPYRGENPSSAAVSGPRDIDAKTKRKASTILRSLDNRRREKDLSKADLARLLDKHPASVRRLFSGVSNPELFTLIQLADALDADIRLVPRRARQDYRQI